MRKVTTLGVSLAVALSVFSFAAQAEVVAGKMVYGTDGKKIGAVYRVAKDGSPQIIINGKLFTIPVASVKSADGKIETTLTRKDVMAGGTAG